MPWKMLSWKQGEKKRESIQSEEDKNFSMFKICKGDLKTIPTETTWYANKDKKKNLMKIREGRQKNFFSFTAAAGHNIILTIWKQRNSKEKYKKKKKKRDLGS